MLRTLFALVVGAGVGLAIPYRLLDEYLPAGWAGPAPSAAPPPVPSVSAAPSASASAEAPEPELTLEEKAAQGDEDALEKLTAMSDAERTWQQNVALSRGEVAQQMKLLNDLEKQMKRDPAFADKPETLAALLKAARDPHTSFRALELIAAQKRESTTDLLYEIWTGVTGRTPATSLAERLVTSNDVRQHASEALSIALDLRDSKDCETIMKLITRTEEAGDVRAVRALTRVVGRRDCGENENEECFPCLRDVEARKALGNAMRSAGKRQPPKF